MSNKEWFRCCRMQCFPYYSCPVLLARLALYPQDDVPRLFKEMSHAASRWHPYWDVLPANGTVLSHYSLPLEYLPLVQHAATVSVSHDTIHPCTLFILIDVERVTGPAIRSDVRDIHINL